LKAGRASDTSGYLLMAAVNRLIRKVQNRNWRRLGNVMKLRDD
jgi:hypothetical protein